MFTVLIRGSNTIEEVYLFRQNNVTYVYVIQVTYVCTVYTYSYVDCTPK